MNKLENFQARARELAQSGQFYGWSPIAFELRFEDGFDDAREWLSWIGLAWNGNQVWPFRFSPTNGSSISLMPRL
jgi:hypothetical protein